MKKLRDTRVGDKVMWRNEITTVTGRDVCGCGCTVYLDLRNGRTIKGTPGYEVRTP